LHVNEINNNNKKKNHTDNRSKIYLFFFENMSSSELIREQSAKAFDGHQYVYNHERYMKNNFSLVMELKLGCFFLFSSTVGCKMKFGIYVPAKAEKERVPLLIFLSGLFWNFYKVRKIYFVN